jgi:hypothetical protein
VPPWRVAGQLYFFYLEHGRAENIFQKILEKRDAKVWTGFNWLGVEFLGGLLQSRYSRIK